MQCAIVLSITKLLWTCHRSLIICRTHPSHYKAVTVCLIGQVQQWDEIMPSSYKTSGLTMAACQSSKRPVWDGSFRKQHHNVAAELETSAVGYGATGMSIANCFRFFVCSLSYLFECIDVKRVRNVLDTCLIYDKAAQLQMQDHMLHMVGILHSETVLCLSFSVMFSACCSICAAVNENISHASIKFTSSPCDSIQDLIMGNNVGDYIVIVRHISILLTA